MVALVAAVAAGLSAVLSLLDLGATRRTARELDRRLAAEETGRTIRWACDNAAGTGAVGAAGVRQLQALRALGDLSRRDRAMIRATLALGVPSDLRSFRPTRDEES